MQQLMAQHRSQQTQRRLSMIRSKISGVGSSLPKRVVPNEELESIVETTSEWIEQRTGIKQRYITDETETSA